MNIVEKLADEKKETLNEISAPLLALTKQEHYVGEVYSLSYETALVQIHDHQRMKQGGIPSLCFLLATRILPKDIVDPKKEDSSVILLRVLDAAALPNASEAERLRVEAAQRAVGPTTHWEEPEIMDAYTAQHLSFAGVKCRVIGTFYLDEDKQGSNKFVLKFGSDISNYYPNRGLKVYKPSAEALERIVNFREAVNEQDNPLHAEEVEIGRIRYASTDRKFQNTDDVRVHIAPADLLGQKSALFGMTRSGKSNTTKIMLQSVFKLREKKEIEGSRIGQLVLDYNGEYANENVQDKDHTNNPQAIKNVWDGVTVKDDVVTYGTTSHPNDPDRKIMKINFYGGHPASWTSDDDIHSAFYMLQIGKEIINKTITSEKGSKYINNFIDVEFTPPSGDDKSAMTRFRRAVLAYRSLLAYADFAPPSGLPVSTKNLFKAELLEAMENSRSDENNQHKSAAKKLKKVSLSWKELASAMDGLRDFIERGKETGYQEFDEDYIKKSSTGDSWADTRLLNILGMFKYVNGQRLVARANRLHSPDQDGDYTDAIYEDLKNGRLVIIDQSAGSIIENREAAERIMSKIFDKNMATFTEGAVPPHVLIYIEEAHNILPKGKDEDLQNIWVKTAKEGAKLNIGFVYATQEVSSIQKNILKNTSNWFIGHLNNKEETSELRKYYDFVDFESSILRAQDKGFLRIKTLSNKYIIPVQVDRFMVSGDKE